jgi:hypothetical protein
VSSNPALTTWADILDATQLAIAPLADTIKVAWFDDTVAPNKSTDTAYGVAPWNAGELAGGSYSAGGVALGSKTITIVSNRIVFAGTMATITGLTDTVRYALLYDDTVSDRILVWSDLGSLLTLSGEDLVVTAPDGWFRIT